MINFREIKKTIVSYSKVFENYFFMTFLHGANLLIGLIIYPYLIRVLGKEIYGNYVFAASIISFFSVVISFGFNYPALKKISLHVDNHDVKNETVSEVFTCKSILFIISFMAFSLLVYFIPYLRENYLLYLILFSITFSDVLFPNWYFQGIQRMRVVTFIQLATKLLSIPFILFFIKGPDDIIKYAIIFSLTVNSGGIISIIYLRITEKIKLSFISLRKMKPLFKDALPFFWTHAIGVTKRESVTLIIGMLFGMKDVALYDLANKIVTIPRILTMSINDAIFPKIIVNTEVERVKKIINLERIIGLFFIAIVAVFGYWAILILGGKEMTGSYLLAVILSTTIYSWLIVGCFINYVFIPQNKYYFITKNQLLSLITFLLICFISLSIFKSIYLIILAYSLSGLIEILYCRYLISKHRLL